MVHEQVMDMSGVEEFLEFARRHVPDNNGRFYYQCANCLNDRRLCVEELREHDLCDGFNKSYTRWIWHGEFETSGISRNEEVDEDMYDRLEDMINDVGVEAFGQAHAYKGCETLSADADKPLYNECKKFSRLCAALKLFALKASRRWSDKSFTELLYLLKHMLPEENELPYSNYKAKKILCPLGMGYKKIHTCTNDCIFLPK